MGLQVSSGMDTEISQEIIYGNLRKYLGEVLSELALQREFKVLEGHLMGDHVHMLVSIPPKYAVSTIVRYLKGKSTMILFERYSSLRRNFRGQSF